MADGTDASPALGAEDIAWLEARSRASQPAEAEPRPRRRLLLGIALAHLLLAIVVNESMRPSEFAPIVVEDEGVMYFDFVPAPAAPAHDPAAAVPEPARVPRAQPLVRPRENAPMVATFVPAESPAPVVEPAPKLRLFNSDGSVIVPDADVSAPVPDYRERVVEKSPLFERKRALPVRSTRFAKVWKPEGENLGQEIVRKFPLAAILLQGVNTPKCPPRSIDPDCEAQPVPQRFDDIVPDGF